MFYDCRFFYNKLIMYVKLYVNCLYHLYKKKGEKATKMFYVWTLFFLYIVFQYTHKITNNTVFLKPF